MPDLCRSSPYPPRIVYVIRSLRTSQAIPAVAAKHPAMAAQPGAVCHQVLHGATVQAGLDLLGSLCYTVAVGPLHAAPTLHCCPACPGGASLCLHVTPPSPSSREYPPFHPAKTEEPLASVRESHEWPLALTPATLLRPGTSQGVHAPTSSASRPAAQPSRGRSAPVPAAAPTVYQSDPSSTPCLLYVLIITQLGLSVKGQVSCRNTWSGKGQQKKKGQDITSWPTVPPLVTSINFNYQREAQAQRSAWPARVPV